MKKNLIRIAAMLVCLILSVSMTVCAAAEGEENGKRVYFAAPLFNQAEKEMNLKLTELLEEFGYEVFLPQRDGYLAVEFEGMTEEEMSRKIFDKDREEILKADILFILLDGRVPDEGACVELGIAYAAGIRCYGVKTDVRWIEEGIEINPMITGCFTRLFKEDDGEKLFESIREYLAENEL